MIPARGGPIDDRRLDDGLEQLGLGGRTGIREGLLRYLAELRRWNRRYNLVSRASEPDALTRHIFDCLAVSPFTHGPRLLDVGTGAGLPGLLLALVRPELHCVLLDANSKKTRFCLHASAELGLDNVEVVHSRLADFRSAVGFSTVVARAFGSTRALVEGSSRLLAPGGRVLSMKGAAVQAELDGLGAMSDNARAIPVHVPGLGAKRHLIIVARPTRAAAAHAVGP